MNLFRYLPSWFGHIERPVELDLEKIYVLHLFDTPAYAYVLLDRFLNYFKISALIHSGNLSSKLSLHTYPHQMTEYENHLSLLKQLMNKHNIQESYISLSPNDHLPSIRRVLPQTTTFSKQGEALINDCHFVFTYDPQMLSMKSHDFPLYRRHHEPVTSTTLNTPYDPLYSYYFELIDPSTHIVYPIKLPIK